MRNSRELTVSRRKWQECAFRGAGAYRDLLAPAIRRCQPNVYPSVSRSGKILRISLSRGCFCLPRASDADVPQFRNTDPRRWPRLWQKPRRAAGLFQPVSCDLLEKLVFAKLYFDYGGLLLACDDGQPVGFAHAGFGPNAEQNWIATETGVICMLMVRPGCAEAGSSPVGYWIAARSTCGAGGPGSCMAAAYRRSARSISAYMGAASCRACSTRTRRPGNTSRPTAIRRAERTALLRRELSGFEPLISRQQMRRCDGRWWSRVTVDVSTRSGGRRRRWASSI